MKNEELVLLYQQGDKQSLEMLIEKNIGFVNKIANKFYTEKTSSIDREDLIQEGTIGLIIAAQRYSSNIENSANFITYSFYWIYQKINRFIKERNTNEVRSLNVSIGSDGNETELIDMVDSNDDSVENIEDKLYLQQLRKELEETIISYNTLREREVLKLYFGWDTSAISMKDIGDILNISKDRVKQIKVAAINKIRSSKWGMTKGIKYRNEIIGQRCNYLSAEKEIDDKLREIRFLGKNYNSLDDIKKARSELKKYRDMFSKKMSPG